MTQHDHSPQADLGQPAQLRIASPRPGSPPAWNGLADASDESNFCSTWLSLICARIPGVTSSLLALRKGSDGKLGITAIWPKQARELPNLARLAELANTERRIAVSRNPTTSGSDGSPLDTLLIAVPLGVDETIGAVALSVSKTQTGTLPSPENVAERVRWGAGWLAAVPLARRSGDAGAKLAVARACCDLMVVCGEQHRLNGLAITIVNELATRLDCDRVCLGLVKRNGAVRLRAISHSSRFKNEGRLVDAIENAMEEAIDQHGTVAFPALAETGQAITLAHQSLAGIVKGDRHLLTVVLPDGRGRPVGAITLERHPAEPFDTAGLRLAEAIAALVGPLTAQQVRADRWFAGRVIDLAGDGVTAILGRRRPSLKLAALVILGLAFYLPFATGEHRVTAKAVLEPQLQRATVAPFDGYIKSAYARAGDRVKQGDPLVQFDDRDLVLERLRQRTELDKLLQKHRDALANHERTNVMILDSQVRQARSALALAEAMLARSRIVAPFDGIVVSGDLSQSLGSPVTKGDILFEVAPLDDYRLIVNVDERDVRYLTAGQTGKVSVAGSPGQPLAIEVTRIMPVAVAADGGNALRIEARLTETTPTLQPGLEGVAKIDVGERNLLWIWSHRLIEAVRLAIWKYKP